MTTPAGWYDDGSGRQRWWDGNAWTDSFQDEGSTMNAAAPVLSFVSQIATESFTVEVFPDRMEWAQTNGGVSAGKIAAGIFTAGLSLAATGVGKGSYSAKKTTDLSIIQLASVTGIASQKDGKRVVVTVSTPSMALALNLPKKEAERVARSLNDLVSAAKAAQQQSQQQQPTISVQVNQQAPAQAASATDPMIQLQKLAELHQQGILSEAEFAAAKAKALGL